MGDSKLYYSFVQSSPYYFNLVISNTRVPVAAVSIDIGGTRVELTRTNNNNWAYHNSQGAYTFPMDITITPVCGDAVRILPPSTCGHPNFHCTHKCRLTAAVLIWRTLTLSHQYQIKFLRVCALSQS